MLRTFIRDISNVIFYKLGMKIIVLRPRPAIRYIKKINEENIIGVEVGVLGGDHSSEILKHLPMKKLYLVDPYKLYESEDPSKNFRSQGHLDAMKKIAQKRFKGNKRVKFVYKKSEDAINDIPDNLDFVYLDGDHRTEQVYKEMENYWKKIRVGGVLSGHNVAGYKEGFDGLVRFCVKYKLSPVIIPYQNDWYIVKNENKRTISKKAERRGK